jgi:hypothetical protein
MGLHMQKLRTGAALGRTPQIWMVLITTPEFTSRVTLEIEARFRGPIA